MTLDKDVNYRKIVRNIKGRIELTERTPLKDLESIFLEMYEFGLKSYIRVEKERFPKKSRKEIIIDMYKLHDKLRGHKHLDGTYI
jgi:hypothetical protein